MIGNGNAAGNKMVQGRHRCVIGRRVRTKPWLRPLGLKISLEGSDSLDNPPRPYAMRLLRPVAPFWRAAVPFSQAYWAAAAQSNNAAAAAVCANAHRRHAFTLTAQERRSRFRRTGLDPLWLYGEALFRSTVCVWAKVSMRRSSIVLKEHTSIHWHGVRGPNAMDGVPFVTQMPVQPGESFCLSLHAARRRHVLLPSPLQHGRAIGPRPFRRADRRRRERAFDDDIVCVLKDGASTKNGEFLPSSRRKGAGRGGTSEPCARSMAASPEISVPPMPIFACGS
jgi:hypothetical protein